MATRTSSAKRGRTQIDAHPIVWLTGQSGSGKTTLARLLQSKIGGIMLDGDDMRDSISRGAGFGRKDRHDHNVRVARLAGVLSRQSIVIVSVIAPYTRTRAKITSLIEPIWIHVHRRGEKRGARYPYEMPRKPHLTLDTGSLSPSESVRHIQGAIKSRRA